MLSAGQIELMREGVQMTFTTLCTRQTKSDASDGKGGRAVTWQDAGTFYGRISTRPDTSRQSAGLGGVIDDSGYSISYPHDQALNAEDRVQADGVTYEVQAAWSGGTYDLHGRASLRRIG